MLTLNLARALTGIGGGGLLTMATVILSDLIPFHKRGIYQAINNLTMGVGGVLGASLGGIIADNFGWRWAFFLQLPFAVFGILVGFIFISSPPPSTHGSGLGQIDYLGSSLLVVGLAIQLMGMNLGGNELPWGSPVVVGCLVISGIILATFLYVEGLVAEQPVLPLSILTEPASITNNIFAAGACTAVQSSSFVCANESDGVYVAPILPGGTFRVCIKGRTAISSPGHCFTHGRPRLGNCDVKMGPPWKAGKDWIGYSFLRLLSHQYSRRSEPTVETLHISPPNNIRSRTRLSKQSLCDARQIRTFTSVHLILRKLIVRASRYNQCCLLIPESRLRVGHRSRFLAFTNPPINKITSRSRRNPSQKRGTSHVDTTFLIQRLLREYDTRSSTSKR